MLLLLVELKPAFYLSAILTIFSDKLSYTVVAEVHKRKPSLLSLVFITKNTELEEDEMIRLACLIVYCRFGFVYFCLPKTLMVYF